VSQVDPAHPCTGAVEDRNDYFFQESGRFGSLDQDTVLVDDGSYRMVDANTIAIVGRLTGRAFLADYAITHDRIRFDVADQANCAGDCREDLAWVLSMFYPGELSRAE
jgi:hypothetical protein